MMQIFMTMDQTRSSIICTQGRVVPVLHVAPAPGVFDMYLRAKPIPAHQNGMKTSK